MQSFHLVCVSEGSVCLVRGVCDVLTENRSNDSEVVDYLMLRKCISIILININIHLDIYYLVVSDWTRRGKGDM